jgi:peptidoglycan/LPS O-acetylase OafA/YrhL
MAKRLLQLNGLATLGVILNHSASLGFIAMFWWTNRYQDVPVPNFDQLGSFWYFVLRFIEQLVAYSVPAFLFVSGFFIAFATGRNPFSARWPVIGTRIINLVIPYLLWSLFIFALEAVQGQTDTLWGYLQKLLVGGAADPYYFIPLLIQLLILSPFMMPLAKNRWKLLLLLTFALQLTAQLVHYPPVLGFESPVWTQLSALAPGWLFVTKVFWFAFGMVVSLHLTAFNQWLAGVARYLPVLLVLFLILCMAEWELLLYLSPDPWIPYFESALDNLYAVTFILCFVYYSQRPFPAQKPIADLGTKSFGVYLVHGIALLYTARIIYHVAPWILGHQLIFQPILYVMGLGVPLLLMTAVKRSPARRFYRYLFG